MFRIPEELDSNLEEIRRFHEEAASNAADIREPLCYIRYYSSLCRGSHPRSYVDPRPCSTSGEPICPLDDLGRISAENVAQGGPELFLVGEGSVRIDAGLWVLVG